jgi:F420-non-reducing hydrogenase large subunit
VKRIRIDPITRLEGHGKIEILLDEQGNVANAYFQTPELRGFEQFCVGRRAEDMPTITSRICGVCPEAHHIASVKALDRAFAAPPPPAAEKIRELLYMAFFVTDHTTHFYALGGPDFIVGPDAPPAERNLLGVVRKVGPEIARSVIDCRARNHRAIEMLGGRGIHPVAGLPGGWSKSVSPAEREEIEAMARENIGFASFSLEVFESLVWSNPAYREMATSDLYRQPLYSMGTVDDRNRPNFYGGRIRVVDPEGRESARFDAADYLDHIAEHVEPWTYLKFPFLKQVGWNGLQGGAESGVYCSTPLSRLNVADGMATPRAQCEFERFHTALGGRPIHHALATHWARLIELLYAAERMLELATDPEITSPDVRNMPGRVEGEGVGSVEAPRGTLIHHYETDEKGLIRKVNLIVGTTNNHAAISMAIRRAAERLIQGGAVVEEGILNRIEMAFRLYDPCLSCATHSLPGAMPLIVRVRDASGEIVRTFRRGD